MKIISDQEYGTRECPSCAVDVPENSNTCPICGYAFPHPSTRQKHMKLWGAVIMLGIFAYFYARYFL